MVFEPLPGSVPSFAMMPGIDALTSTDLLGSTVPLAVTTEGSAAQVGLRTASNKHAQTIGSAFMAIPFLSVLIVAPLALVMQGVLAAFGQPTVLDCAGGYCG